jgi:hypothetical protein
VNFQNLRQLPGAILSSLIDGIHQDQFCQTSKWGQGVLGPKADFVEIKSGKVMLGGRLDGIVIGLVGLDYYPAA